ncbi:MAG: hypothetical protein K8E66_00440, partial [Phycisphaerales bacterium]|nr:hypothetical protein [Phycisphaerales bacterium]
THCQIKLDAVLEPGVPFFESAGPDPETRRDRYLDHLYRADEEAHCGGPDRCAWCAAEARP